MSSTLENNIDTETLSGFINRRSILVVIIGATAAGKSDVAVRIAKQLNGEIVSLDSMQVYKGMDIGTAKIKPEDMQSVKHHLTDIAEPTGAFSAGEFAGMAEEKIAEIFNRNHNPIIVGGTGLYLDALLKGLFPTPARNSALRGRLQRWQKKEGLEGMHRYLRRADRESANKTKKGDKQRIHRAIEIFLVTGQSASFQKLIDGFGKDRYQSIKIGLKYPNRNMLYNAIEERVDRMIEAGWVDEVRELIQKYSPDSHPFKAIGYRELTRYIKEELSLQEAVEIIKKRTRNYAKRQLTWFRKLDDVEWFEVSENKDLVSKRILEYINGYFQRKR